MVSGPCILSPEHTRRVRICDATRNVRREIARNRVRRPLQEVGNILQPIDCGVQFRLGSMHGNHHSENIIENNMSHNNNNDTCMRGNIAHEDDVTNENVDTNDIANRSHYVYPEGNYAKVDKCCL